MYHAKTDGGTAFSVPKMVRHCFSVPHFRFYGTLCDLRRCHETQNRMQPIRESEQLHVIYI